LPPARQETHLTQWEASKRWVGSAEPLLAGLPHWSVFWDRKYGVWRAAEDDPGLALYAESRDVDPMIGYIATPLLDVP
jgi:hypothetical protein